MITKDSHIIQQQYFEIQFDDFPGSVGVQNEIRDLFYEKLLPEIEGLFDEISQSRYTISIEKLDIDCGKLNSKSWKEELVTETLSCLNQELRLHHKKEIDETDLEFSDSFQSFFYFLRKGWLPWNNRIDTIRDLEDQITDRFLLTEKNLSRLKELFRNRFTAIERLVYSFSDHFSQNILERLAGNKKEILDHILADLDKEVMSGQKKHFTRALLLKVFSEDHADPEQPFHESMESSLRKGDGGKEPTKIRHSETQHEETESIYIGNAGLVILHPFLNELFTRIGLIRERRWKDSSSRHVAVSVLEFLVSGQENIQEFNSSLNKILCGMEISEVLEPVEILDPGVKVECMELLSEVIRHWSILKNTSVDGLRESFLQREGKLSPVDKGWLLHVEQKGMDVLLNSLPWGIGTIKLPWTEDKLHVEWI